MDSTIIPQVAEITLTYRSKVKAANRPKIQSSYDAEQLFRMKWSEEIEFFEECYILLTDRANRVMAHYKVSQGGLAGTVVDAKIVFAAALKCRASAIIIAHNHPSGALRPSKQDEELTYKLRKAGELLDLPILDHLILSPDGGYYSFADEGRMV